MPPAPSRIVCGVGGDVGDQHAGGRRGDRGHVVVLGVPDPPVPVPLRRLGQRDAGGEAVARGLPGADRGQVQDRQRNGHGNATLSRRAPHDAPAVRLKGSFNSTRSAGGHSRSRGVGSRLRGIRVRPNGSGRPGSSARHRAGNTRRPASHLRFGVADDAVRARSGRPTHTLMDTGPPVSIACASWWSSSALSRGLSCQGPPSSRRRVGRIAAAGRTRVTDRFGVIDSRFGAASRCVASARSSAGPPPGRARACDGADHGGPGGHSTPRWPGWIRAAGTEPDADVFGPALGRCVAGVRARAGSRPPAGPSSVSASDFRAGQDGGRHEPQPEAARQPSRSAATWASKAASSPRITVRAARHPSSRDGERRRISAAVGGVRRRRWRPERPPGHRDRRRRRGRGGRWPG